MTSLAWVALRIAGALAFVPEGQRETIVHWLDPVVRPEVRAQMEPQRDHQ